MPKNLKLSEILQFFPKRSGGLPLFPPLGARGTSEGVDPHVTNYVSDPNETFITPVPCLYLQYIRRYKRRGTKVRSPRSARSTAPWERRRRLTHILEINFEVSGKHFTSRYYLKKFRNFWAIRSWKLGEKNTFLGARGQGGHRRGSTPMSGALGRVPTKLFFTRSYVEIFDSFWVLLSTNFDWKSESLKLGKSESRKYCPIRKKNFSSFFLDQVEPKSEKKTKVKILKSSDISSSRFCATRPKGWRPREKYLWMQ